MRRLHLAGIAAAALIACLGAAGCGSGDGSSGRATGSTAAGPQGALFVSDDTAGAIYKLVPPR